MTKSTIERFEEMVSNISSTSGTKAKMEHLSVYKDDKEVMDLLAITLNPFKKFNITSKQIEKRVSQVTSKSALSLMVILNKLTNREVTGDAALTMYKEAINAIGHEETLLNILDKDLKFRMGVSNVNKVSDIIPTFDVALAVDYFKHEKAVKLNEADYYGSVKLDGVRCIIMEQNGRPAYFSRKGLEFTTLTNLDEEIMAIENWENKVFDGEICIIENGVEVFAKIVGAVKRKNSTIDNPKYFCFDVLTREEFVKKSSIAKLSERIMRRPQPSAHIEIVEQVKIESEEAMLALFNKFVDAGREGLMIRKDSAYKGKRSNELLKLKKFKDEEYTVLEITTNDHTDLTGGGSTEALASVIIDHKGSRVSVGSGFTKEQRARYFADPSLIIGKTINVRYFEETKTDTGYSLRFPTVNHIYENGRDC